MTTLNETGKLIDTVIFDIGRVLVDFQPDIPLNRHFRDPEIRARLKTAVYNNPAWAEADRGVLPESEIVSRFIAADPGLEREIREAYKYSCETIRLFPYTEEWIRSLKSRGFRVFCLSNYSRRLRETTAGELRFLSLLDGVLFSYACGLIKPDPEIYRLLFQNFDIRPESAVFLDDNGDNIRAANQEHLNTILFAGYEQARAELEALLPPTAPGFSRQTL